MSSVWGNNIKLSIFGEAQGEVFGGTLHDFPAGIPVNLDRIKLGLKLRLGNINFTSMRKQDDRPVIVSGVHKGVTNGAPITVLFYNKNASDTESGNVILKPSHADYVADVRYRGYADQRDGGHFASKITLPIVFFGMLCADYLQHMGIKVVSHVKAIGNIQDESFGVHIDDELIERLNSMSMPTISNDVRKRMVSLLQSISAIGDSIGGAVETAIVGLPAGFGSPCFDGLESKLASLIFALPGVKSISFGLGNDFVKARGSEVADSFYVTENGKIETDNNFNGGLNRGISNGMPIIMNTVFKPIPSIQQPMKGLDLVTNEIVDLKVNREHTVCHAPEGNVLATSVAAIVTLDSILEGEGYMNMPKVEKKKIKPGDNPHK
ncbi:MAG TPA: chorismate synthase [Clostridia bacterium]|jgi:chorismate synthase|nr:chorismate synthase [Clostridia bacterium]